VWTDEAEDQDGMDCICTNGGPLWQ